VRLFFGDVPCDGQEDLIQAGAAQRKILDADALIVEAPDSPPEDRPVEDPHRDQLSIGVGSLTIACEDRQDALCRGEVGRIAGTGLQDLSADTGLELQRRPRRDDPPAVDDDDLIGQAVGLLQILCRQQHGRALRHQSPNHPPELDPAPGVESGGGLVEVQESRAADLGSPPGPTGGASRLSMS
jgi:hypothetical protein